MKEVEFTTDNYTKCLCPVCPVQATSACVAGKRKGWRRQRADVGEILKEYAAHPETYDMPMKALESNEVGTRHGFKAPGPADMIELYCSKAVGRSNCDDLDGDKKCQCPTCAVWESHELNSHHYCLKEAE